MYIGTLLPNDTEALESQYETTEIFMSVTSNQLK